MKTQANTYTQRGVVKGKPIGLRLSPDELEKVARLAEGEHRSLASTARILLIKGLETVQQDKTNLTA